MTISRRGSEEDAAEFDRSTPICEEAFSWYNGCVVERIGNESTIER